MELAGKLALITGGGHGIGRGIVERFLAAGARVAVVQRRPLIAELSEAIGIRADLSDPAVLPRVAEEAASALGGLDILVNNAGMMFERGVGDLTVAEWDLMMALNLRAPMFLTQAVLPQLQRSEGGSVINIGSLEGIAANPNHTAYSATKADLHGMTRAMAVDLGPRGIRCNAIAPGWIETGFNDNYVAAGEDPAAVRESLNELHPVGRLGLPADIGELAVFLASQRAGFLTGETIVLDGGRTAKLPLPSRMS